MRLFAEHVCCEVVAMVTVLTLIGRRGESCIKMVAADQAFDSLQRLQEFEELFKNRYTESDKEYKKATQEGHRFLHEFVPLVYSF